MRKGNWRKKSWGQS